MKRRFTWLGFAAIALGFAVIVYRGPGRGVIRGHVGDVAATMLVYALLGTVWSARLRTRALVTLGIATAIELVQVVWHARSFLGELLIGSTFDAWDLVAYVVGVCVAVVWESVGERAHGQWQSPALTANATTWCESNSLRAALPRSTPSSDVNVAAK